jgi:DNA-directed RNA polymerase subunit RPC12/RpoP
VRAVGRVPITVMGYRCDRCEHEWIPRGDVESEPRVCPRCKSPYWNKPRRTTPAMTYDQFRKAVTGALQSSGRPMTWTEIRTTAGLPQKWPNNQWVRRLDREIPLIRARESPGGTIYWSLDLNVRLPSGAGHQPNNADPTTHGADAEP